MNHALRVRELASTALSRETDPREALREILKLAEEPAGASGVVPARVPASPAQLSGSGVLRNIIGTIPYFVFWKDRNCVYGGCNDAFAKIAGMESPEGIVGRTDHELPWKKEEADFFVECDQRVMSSGVAEMNIEEPMKMADGRNRYLQTSKVPLRDEHGTVIGILGIFTDITERKQMEVDLRLAKEAAEASDQAKGDFLAAMSHELRTPLTLILGPMESLLQDRAGDLPADVLALVQRSHRNACRLKALTDDILDFSKGQAGFLALANENFDAVARLRALVDDLLPAAESKGITLTFASSCVDAKVVADVRKLDKIMLNLVGNALKFTPAGGRVDVRMALDGPQLKIEVQDSGIGIDPGQHDKLFSRFMQLDAGSTRKYGGTGLGLALVKQFADLMGGSLALRSALGEGSTFSLCLPIEPERGGAALAPDAEALTSAQLEAQRRSDALIDDGSRVAWAGSIRPAGTPNNSPRLLIAEDNVDLRNYIVSLFEQDYAVSVAGNGIEALALARSKKPHVILSDVMMPEMDGFQLVARIREDAELRTTPVLLLTARAGAEASASSLNSGADDYVTKPFNPLELRARVNAARRLNELNAQLRDAQASVAETERLAGLGRLLAKLAHEINNPMNVIANTAESLRDYAAAALRYADACEAAAKTEASSALQGLRQELDWGFVRGDLPLAVDQLAQAARRVQSLQSDFRMFLRGEQAICVEPADLRETIEQTLDQVRRMFTGSRRFEARLAPGIELSFDRNRLGQALFNLFKNAAEASGDHGEVVVEAHAEADMVSISVTDCGPGIAPDVMHKIFEPFFTTKDVGLGTGLGLAISREVVEHHGGSLRAENVGAIGARFTILLPKREAATRVRGVRARSERPAAAAELEGRVG